MTNRNSMGCAEKESMFKIFKNIILYTKYIRKGALEFRTLAYSSNLAPKLF